MNGLGFSFLLFFPGAAMAAYCPSFTLSSPENTGNCSTEAATGQNPTIAEWNVLFETLSQPQSSWPLTAPPLGTIRQGCNRPEAPRQVPARVPCEMFKAMAMQESLWQQFCVPTSPVDQQGKPAQTIIAKDCGYGVVQITSGMRQGETPNYEPNRVASEPFYNLAIGANILMQKWRVTRCVGDNQPQVLENWYSAVWAYNGLSYKNNPANPVYSSARGVWNPRVGGPAPYQEKVYGWIEKPPSPAHWQSLALAYPDVTQVGGAGAPLALDEPACGSPVDCTNTRPTHLSQCDRTPEPDAGVVFDAGVATEDAGTVEPPDAGSSAPDAGIDLPAVDTLLPGGAEEYYSTFTGGCGSASGLFPLLGIACAVHFLMRKQPFGR